MILDAQQQFSDAQALSGAGADPSTNIIDISNARELFAGKALVILVSVDVAADLADGDETYSFAVETDDNAGFSSATVLETKAVDKALLVAGYKFTIPMPAESDVEQYLRLNFTLGGTTPTVTVTAFLQPRDMVDQKKDYPDAISIV